MSSKTFQAERLESVTASSATVPVQITDDATHVTITSANATYAAALPTATAGKQLTLYVGANGCELWGKAAGDKLNDVVIGATNEAAIPATSFCRLFCHTAGEWIMEVISELGAVVTAVVPDAR